MARLKLHLQGASYRQVLSFIFRHWAHQPLRVVTMFALLMLATVLDVRTPLYAGQLVEAVSKGGTGALNSAIVACAILIGLGLGSVVIRQFGFMAIIEFTLRIM